MQGFLWPSSYCTSFTCNSSIKAFNDMRAGAGNGTFPTGAPRAGQLEAQRLLIQAARRLVPAPADLSREATLREQFAEHGRAVEPASMVPIDANLLPPGRQV